MANSCPNCGRSTVRTKDWCCQWCGYPLFSGSFKTIDKTYKELKSDRLSRESVIEEDDEDIVEDALESAEEAAAEAVTPQPDVAAGPSASNDNVEIIEETIIEDPDHPRRVIRRIRRVRPESEPPVRRVVRRRRPETRSRPPAEEVIEYVDEDTEDIEEYYEDDYEDEEVYVDEYEDDEYEEEVNERPRPEAVRRPARKPRPVRREPTGPSRPARKNKILRRPRPEPEYEEVEDYEDDLEEEEPENYVDDFEEESDDEEYEDEYEEYDDDDEDEEAYDDEDEYEDEETDDADYLAVATVDDVVEEPEEEIVEEEVEPDIELTVDDLVTAYETEGPDADARFAHRNIRISGRISKVDVKESMSVYNLVLETEDGNPMRQSVRCVFNRENGKDLEKLVKNQNVSVQGNYDGSIINISMRDCRLIGIID